MLDLLKTGIGRFRLLSFMEGTSLLLILFVSMPLKYGMGIEEPNKVIGMAHGLLFMLYVLAVIQNKITRDWSYKTMFIALAVSIIPFGTFWADKKLFKDME
jgi:integral membrane protein